MGVKRKQHSADFKARVAMAARPHQALSWQTPDEAYFGQSAPAAAAAA